jgi:hypothetical protein
MHNLNRHSRIVIKMVYVSEYGGIIVRFTYVCVIHLSPQRVTYIFDQAGIRASLSFISGILFTSYCTNWIYLWHSGGLWTNWTSAVRVQAQWWKEITFTHLGYIWWTNAKIVSLTMRQYSLSNKEHASHRWQPIMSLNVSPKSIPANESLRNLLMKATPFQHSNNQKI